MKSLRIDIETFSGNDLIKGGVYRYVEAQDFEVLLFGYAYDDEPVRLVDLAAKEWLPDHVLDDLTNPAVLKTAFNANFERVCLGAHFGLHLDPSQWHCTSVLALQLGLPQHLAEVARVIGLPLDKQKMSEGKKLIRQFCCPVKPTKKHPSPRWYRNEDPVAWSTFRDYCIRDVEVERAVALKLAKGAPTEIEWQAYWLDQKINDVGIGVDTTLVAQAIEADAVSKARITAELIRITGLHNPNSVKQLKTWLEDETFITIDSLNKAAIPELIKDADDATIAEVLRLRLEAAKTSVKKYKAMANMVCADDRIHGMLQFYGANRTGRWAGRGVQVHNLPKSALKQEPHDDLLTARTALRAGNYEGVELAYGNVPDTLSQLIRTAFVPHGGGTYLIIDFSAIEARMLAWLANERWRIEVFKTHGKIYEASASAMFGVPLESITKGNPLRQKGKVSELALGYQGGPGALVTMGALKMGLTEDELPPLVKAWRVANENIVNFWWAIDRASKAAVETGQPHEVPVGLQGAERITFRSNKHFMHLGLPSGRELAYYKPRIERDERFDKDGITYDGIDQDTKQWGRLRTYGGKLVENICQAACRDLLRDALFALDRAGYKIVAHVHDEVIIEYRGADPTEALKDCERIMGLPCEWAPGLPLRGDGFISAFYKKGD